MPSEHEPNVVYQWTVTMHRSNPDVPDEFSVEADTRHEAVGIAATWEREHSPDAVEVDVEPLPCPICGETFVEFLELDSPEEATKNDHMIAVGDKIFAHRHSERLVVDLLCYCGALNPHWLRTTDEDQHEKNVRRARRVKAEHEKRTGHTVDFYTSDGRPYDGGEADV